MGPGILFEQADSLFEQDDKPPAIFATEAQQSCGKSTPADRAVAGFVAALCTRLPPFHRHRARKHHHLGNRRCRAACSLGQRFFTHPEIHQGLKYCPPTRAGPSLNETRIDSSLAALAGFQQLRTRTEIDR